MPPKISTLILDIQLSSGRDLVSSDRSSIPWQSVVRAFRRSRSILERNEFFFQLCNPLTCNMAEYQQKNIFA